MWVTYGQSALSNFRKRRLLAKIQTAGLPLQDVSVRYVYFIANTQETTTDEKSRLELLIQHEGEHYHPLKKVTLTRVVIPRPGTISPWSSKATDIASHCGIRHIARIERGLYIEFEGLELSKTQLSQLERAIHDPLTQAVLASIDDAHRLFNEVTPQPLQTIPLLEEGKAALENANMHYGFALNADEISYLNASYQRLERNPTDIELMMFAQANSEHCRHKIFNATWHINGVIQPLSLFEMIKNTHRCHPEGTQVAYKDNASVIKGHVGERFFPDADGIYHYNAEDISILMKVETHNHPTAISPYPGAATGAGGGNS